MEIVYTAPVVWFFIGLLFLVLELVLPGLIIVFFGIGAIITALLTWFFDPSINIQIIFFIISSILGIIGLRKYLKKALTKDSEKANKIDFDEEFIGRHAIAETNFDGKSIGKVQFKGAQWSARSNFEIEKGQEVEILNKDNITLIIKPLN